MKDQQMSVDHFDDQVEAQNYLKEKAGKGKKVWI